jgi:hypothetical protein
MPFEAVWLAKRRAKERRAAYRQSAPDKMGWLMGFEPTTTGITIRTIERRQDSEIEAFGVSILRSILT